MIPFPNKGKIKITNVKLFFNSGNAPSGLCGEWRKKPAPTLTLNGRFFLSHFLCVKDKKPKLSEFLSFGMTYN